MRGFSNRMLRYALAVAQALVAACVSSAWAATPTERTALLAGNGPSLSLDFTHGVLPRGVSFSRSGGQGATCTDATGTLQYLAAGLPCFDNSSAGVTLGLRVEEARTNSIRNPRADGAVAGTPGTAPTGWVISPNNGVTLAIVGSGYETGIPYVDILVSGTATSGGATIGVTFDYPTQATAATGQAWTLGAYLRLMSGSSSNFTSPRVNFTERNSSSGFVTQTDSVVTFPTTAPLAQQRMSRTVTLSGGATTALVQGNFFLTINASATVSATIRFGAPQLEQGAFATSVILPVAGSPAATTRAADSVSAPVVSSWYQASPNQSMAFEGQIIGILPVNAYATLAEVFKDANNRFTLFNNPSLFVGIFTDNNGVSAANYGASVSAGALFKLAGSFTSNSFAALNGSVVGQGGKFLAIQNPTSIHFGTTSGGATTLGAIYLKRFRYWPRALSPSELAGVTRQ